MPIDDEDTTPMATRNLSRDPFGFANHNGMRYALAIIARIDSVRKSDPKRWRRYYLSGTEKYLLVVIYSTLVRSKLPGCRPEDTAIVDERVTVASLADHCGVDHATASRAVAKFRRRGFLASNFPGPPWAVPREYIKMSYKVEMPGQPDDYEL